MKTISDHLAGLFQGQLETITATELKKHLGDCLSQTTVGKSFCIKRKGRIVGFLVPPSAADITHEIEADGGCETLPTYAASADDNKDAGRVAESFKLAVGLHTNKSGECRVVTQFSLLGHILFKSAQGSARWCDYTEWKKWADGELSDRGNNDAP